MTVETNTESQARSEKIKMGLKEFLKDAAFGDAKYQAFFDCGLQDELEDDLSTRLGFIKDNPSPIIGSALRILESRKALIDHEIEQKKIMLPGYEDAYWTVYGAVEKLYSALHDEGEDKYPNNPAAADLYVYEEWDHFKHNALPDLSKGEPKVTP